MPANQAQPREHPSPAARSGGAFWPRAASVFLLVAVVWIVLIPGGYEAIHTLRHARAAPQAAWETVARVATLQIIANTGVYVVVIALAAVLTALPAAWLLGRRWTGPARRGSGAWIGLVASPLLLPSYLAYAGWGLLRGPNSWLGDFLARQTPAWSLWADKVSAVWGMTLWVWPLAALVLAASIRKIPPELPELARLDAPSWRGRTLALAAELRAGLLAGTGLVALLTLGSAIPLNVAQVPTYAIQLWAVMQLSPDTTGVWIAAIPLFVVAVVAAWMIVRIVERRLALVPESGGGPAEGGQRTPWARRGTIAVWMLSVVVPLGTFAWSLGDWRSVPMFWRTSGAGVAQSLRIAAVCGGAAAVLLLATWLAVDLGGRTGRAIARVTLGVFLFSGIVPGVLVGACMSSAWSSPSLDGLVSGVWLVVFTHLARFGFVAALGGWWLASVQSREQRWNRDLDGGVTLAAWGAVTLRPQAATVAGFALAVGALSFHEIESTVYVLPPGLANLPQQLLDFLHYARDEQLSAAAVNMLGVGTLVAVGAAWLISAGSRARGDRRDADVQRREPGIGR